METCKRNADDMKEVQLDHMCYLCVSNYANADRINYFQSPLGLGIVTSFCMHV